MKWNINLTLRYDQGIQIYIESHTILLQEFSSLNFRNMNISDFLYHAYLQYFSEYAYVMLTN